MRHIQLANGYGLSTQSPFSVTSKWEGPSAAPDFHSWGIQPAHKCVRYTDDAVRNSIRLGRWRKRIALGRAYERLAHRAGLHRTYVGLIERQEELVAFVRRRSTVGTGGRMGDCGTCARTAARFVRALPSSVTKNPMPIAAYASKYRRRCAMSAVGCRIHSWVTITRPISATPVPVH